jgi:hypothetical protein
MVGYMMSGGNNMAGIAFVATMLFVSSGLVAFINLNPKTEEAIKPVIT